MKVRIRSHQIFKAASEEAKRAIKPPAEFPDFVSIPISSDQIDWQKSDEGMWTKALKLLDEYGHDTHGISRVLVFLGYNPEKALLYAHQRRQIVLDDVSKRKGQFGVDLAKEPSRSMSANPSDAVDYFKEMSEMFEVIAEAAGRSGFLKGGK